MDCYVPEKRNLNKIVGPPHSSWLHQILPKKPGPSKAQYLRRENHDQRNPESQRPLVENLDRTDDMNRVRISGAGVRENRNQYMLFHIKRSWIHREFEFSPFEEHSIWDRHSHEMT